MSQLSDALQQRQAQGKPALIPFVTAGDPSLDATGRVIDVLINAGADVIEIGFPYSDPLADGPVIQASYTRALATHIKLDDIIAHISKWTSKHPSTPMLGMVSFSLVFRKGVAAFFDVARQAGLSGLIIPDLPFEEASKLSSEAAARQLALVQLVTPATPRDRAAAICQSSTGFVYVVSVTGITGTRTALPAELVSQLAELRQMTNLPLCVGFGISQSEHVHLLAGHADGIIVGSALVRCLEGDKPFDEKLAAIGALARELKLK